MVVEGLPGERKPASLRWAYELRRGGKAIEGGHHWQVVGGEARVGAHLGGVGCFQGGSKEHMVHGTHEALRAHPRGGLCKGAQEAHPQAR